MQPFTIIFVALAAAGFYLLIHEEKVRSRLALKWVWTDLGLALMSTAVVHMIRVQNLAHRPSLKWLYAILTGDAIGFLFLGAACIAMVFAVHPVRLGAPNGRRPRRLRRQPSPVSAAPPAWLAEQDAPERAAPNVADRPAAPPPSP